MCVKVKSVAMMGKQRGQALVLFTMMVVVFVGFAAMAVDLGFLFGQRRYDQNGADAAALSVARYLASNVAPLPSDQTGNTVYFSVTDAEVYAKARLYAGLDPNNTSSTAPTGTNQNGGLNSRNNLELSLEYWTGASGDGWCYSPSGPQPPRSPAVPVCTLYASGGSNYPPLPTSNPFKVRLTVSSTTDSFFAQVLIPNGNIGQSSAPTSDNVPACLRPSGANGMLACAQAVAVVSGSPTFQGSGPVIPISACDSYLGIGPTGEMYALWGLSGSVCGINLSSWKQTLDFTSETRWCDDPSGGSTSNPDYRFVNLLPLASHVASGTCASLTQYDTASWNRANFVPDSQYPGTGVQSTDLQLWVSNGFNGTLNIGNKVPVYVDANPSQTGNQGQNIAAGFYCGSQALPDWCSNTPSPNKYYFGQSQPGFYTTCPDDFGTTYQLGCRDATVPTWHNAEYVVGIGQGGANWSSNGSGAPDRVQIANFRNFRIYCSFTAGQNGQPVCNNQPPSGGGGVPGVTGSGNSSVYGRYIAPFVVNCPLCTGGPSLNGNTVSLSE